MFFLSTLRAVAFNGLRTNVYVQVKIIMNNYNTLYIMQINKKIKTRVIFYVYKKGVYYGRIQMYLYILLKRALTKIKKKTLKALE